MTAAAITCGQNLARSAMPPEMIAENARRDREFMVEVAALLRDRHGVAHADPQTLQGLLSLMLSLGEPAR